MMKRFYKFILVFVLLFSCLTLASCQMEEAISHDEFLNILEQLDDCDYEYYEVRTKCIDSHLKRELDAFEIYKYYTSYEIKYEGKLQYKEGRIYHLGDEIRCSYQAVNDEVTSNCVEVFKQEGDVVKASIYVNDLVTPKYVVDSTQAISLFSLNIKLSNAVKFEKMNAEGKMLKYSAIYLEYVENSYTMTALVDEFGKLVKLEFSAIYPEAYIKHVTITRK